ncbi:MAG: hypothetical protein Q8K59_06695 [Nitrosomonas sp.]|nr:hypothetical protein [Nitrosomonas sp.]MDP1950767.1 hypothetical protein [Nitrosomonas sp.]
MAQNLDLTDIQGNIVKAYGSFGFLKARYLFLSIADGDRGRAFVGAMTTKVTSAERWDKKSSPLVTTNIGFTFSGLQALELPTASLIGFPEDFVMGMKKRKAILGDDGPSDPENWDKIWQETAHIWMSINGKSIEAIEERYQWIVEQIEASGGGVTLLTGHRGEKGEEDLPYQDASVLYDQDGKPSAKEHFGYTDGISDPVFEGQTNNQARVLGRGKLTSTGGWEPLATGEFILGHIDEAMEYPNTAPRPDLLSNNGTYMVYRKLHENVGSFNRFLDEQSESFPGSKEMLAAKFSGRWRDNGAPVVNAPDDASKTEWDKKYAAADPAAQRRMLTDFNYNDDISGAKCPLSAHTRRINPRGSLEFGVKDAFDTPGALVNRRRILRRGLPYGIVKDASKDDGNHGIIFMVINVDIKRQFEFVQQQWINFGNDFKQGNDRDVLLGNQSAQNPGRVVIQVEPGSGKPPHFVTNIPRLVETRGGDYFFIPSITALKMIAGGIIDPT